METIRNTNKKAIVTLAIGEKYEEMFENYCRINWQQYCDTFGYDLIVLSESLDSSERAIKRSASWQKLLILSQPWSKEYQRIVWIDTDIVINNTYAIDISNGVPLDKVGAVECYSIPSRDIHDITLERMYRCWDRENINYLDNKTPKSYYTNRGLPENSLKEVLHAGVFVCSPKFHRDIFEFVYNSYEDTRGAEWNYEMPFMSYELVNRKMVHWISPRFNFCVPYIMAAFYPDNLIEEHKKVRKKREGLIWKFKKKIKGESAIQTVKDKKQIYLKNIYDLSIFMHFAGCSDLMPEATFIQTS